MAEATLVFDGKDKVSVSAAAYIFIGDDLDSQTGFKGDVDADIDGCEDEYSDDAAAHKKVSFFRLVLIIH
jgi:hypothetical protein